MKKLTDEQQACVSAAVMGKNLKIKAFAGSGKTSTLIAISKEIENKNILYLVFNKAAQIAAEEKFPSKVSCKTSHSLAYHHYIPMIGNRLNDAYPKFNEEALINYGINDLYGCGKEEIAANAFMKLKYFMQSKYSLSFLKPKPLKKYVIKEELEEAEIDRYTDEIAQEYWNKCIEIGSSLPISHDVYLKLYQLSKPNLSNKYDVILFDECQDANPLLLDIITRQKCQKIYVGDEHQQIYMWRGSENAFKAIKGKALYLSLTFRFGGEAVSIANKILTIKGEEKELKGLEWLDTKIIDAPPYFYTSLCRTNSKTIEVVLKNMHKKVCLFGRSIKGVAYLLNSGYALYKNNLKGVKHHSLKRFKSWDHMLADHSKSIEKDPDISTVINFIAEHGDNVPLMIAKLRSIDDVKEKDADIIISTTHRAKGMEWDNVVVEDDFKLSEKTSDADWNLLYVAATRAQKNLCFKGNLLSELSTIYRNN